MKPSEIKFKRLPIWFRCEDLPFKWMDKERGKSIAEQVGEFISLDFKGNGSSSSWVQCYRARVWVDLDEPLIRGFPIESKKKEDGRLVSYLVRAFNVFPLLLWMYRSLGEFLSNSN
jgi:hypothetical protein